MEKIKKDIEKYVPDFIILNSAGLTLEDGGFQMLRDKGIISVGLEMSDPDVFPYNGALFAHKFDIFYTNAKYSFNHQYDIKTTNIKLLPFAASIEHHFYIPDAPKIYDVVVVGHAREDRLRVINKLKRYKLGLYGSGWGNGGLGEVHGLSHVRAINSGKIYLSFAGTAAGYQNVKVGLFEAMACNSFVVTGYMDELNDYFEIGKEVVCYKNEDELVSLIDYYLSHNEEREQIRRASYERFLKEHTYTHRWEDVLKQISATKYGNKNE
jgi:spore maturation protein CgeB